MLSLGIQLRNATDSIAAEMRAMREHRLMGLPGGSRRHIPLPPQERAMSDSAQDGEQSERSIEYLAADQDFEQLLSERDIVLVDFHADWCGPCHQMEPMVADLAEEIDHAVVKVDVDQRPDIAQQFGVRSIPTFIVFADGEVEARLVGVQPKDQLLDALP